MVVAMELAGDPELQLLHLDLELVVELDGQPADSANHRFGSIPVRNAAPGQSNEARADAEAAATVRVDQTATQDGSGAGTQYAGQLIEVGQDAEAAPTPARRTSYRWRGAKISPAVEHRRGDASVVLDASLAGRRAGPRNATSRPATSGAGRKSSRAGRRVDATASQNDAMLTGTGGYGSRAPPPAATPQSPSTSGSPRTPWPRRQRSKWAGQLTLVEQAVDATSTVDQAGTPRSSVAGGTATATARRPTGSPSSSRAPSRPRPRPGSGRSGPQLVFVAPGRVGARDDRAAGGSGWSTARLERGRRPRTARRSSRRRPRRRRVVRPRPPGALAAVDRRPERHRGLDLERRDRRPATVVNCAVTQQGAAQSIGAGRRPPPGRISRPSASRPAPAPTRRPRTPTPAPVPGPVARPARGRGRAPTATVDDEPTFSTVAAQRHAAGKRTHAARARSGGALRAAAGATRRRAARYRPGFRFRPPRKRASTRARGATQETETPAREPPLPPAGDPPMWISALAAAASGAGSSGIAAILLGLRAHAAAHAAGTRRVGRQAADRRLRTGRRPRLTLSPRHLTRWARARRASVIRL